jgi:hypothetical protein
MGLKISIIAPEKTGSELKKEKAVLCTRHAVKGERISSLAKAKL